MFENLSTSDGPDLRVWLTDQPVIEGRDGWHVFDDGRYVELGPLKANQGNQVYDVPAGTDLDGLTSVSIWCKRFAVSFGAAALRPPDARPDSSDAAQSLISRDNTGRSRDSTVCDT